MSDVERAGYILLFEPAALFFFRLCDRCSPAVLVLVLLVLPLLLLVVFLRTTNDERRTNSDGAIRRALCFCVAFPSVARYVQTIVRSEDHGITPGPDADTRDSSRGRRKRCIQPKVIDWALDISRDDDGTEVSS